MPVNAADLRDGLVYVLGGDWRKYHLASLPSDLVLNVLCSIRWRNLDLSSGAVGLHLFLVDPFGKRLAHQPLIIGPDFPNEGACKFLFTIGASAESAGEYSLQVVAEKFLLAEALVLVVATGNGDQ